MSDSSIGTRRTYDNRARQEKAAQTRQRIIAAGSQLVHEYDSWNWRDLTFRAVAERAGVGERTVYRHFPTERHLHDAVMARLESEAGVSYEDVDLTTGVPAYVEVGARGPDHRVTDDQAQRARRIVRGS